MPVDRSVFVGVIMNTLSITENIITQNIVDAKAFSVVTRVWVASPCAMTVTMGTFGRIVAGVYQSRILEEIMESEKLVLFQCQEKVNRQNLLAWR